MWRNIFWLLKHQSRGLTRAELGPGSSPFVSGVSESLRFRSSENSWVTGVCGCCGVKTEDVLGRDWAMTVLGSSSVMSSQDYRNINENSYTTIMMLPCNRVRTVHHCWSLEDDVNVIFTHVVQVPWLHVLILQVFTDVAPWTENTVRLLMDLPLLIVTLRLGNHITGEEHII